ncbi:hypothetical protein EPO05_06260 [Patescibacteria group bacterium]|nr:MAG: hypothetical protein EPO05_06260 [Patescibacteria group bacterium]
MMPHPDTHWQAFGPEWFVLRQQVLLRLLNAPVIGRLFRWILRIRPYDIGYGYSIVELGPHYYVVQGDCGSLIADIRGHWKYAKRLYFSLRPIWWCLHLWDAAIADRFAPYLSFGFNTLTSYPDADPETTTVDGFVDRNLPTGSGEAWTSIIAGAGNESNSNGTVAYGAYMTGDSVSNQWKFLIRYILLFDTGSIPIGSSITSATLSVNGNNKTDQLSASPDTNIYSSGTASNTEINFADYGNFGSTAFSTAIAYSGWSTTGYNDFILNASGLSNIAIGGISKFGLRNANYDVAASAPPWASLANSQLAGDSADVAGVSTDPKLVITYVPPGSRTVPVNIVRPGRFRPGIAR